MRAPLDEADGDEESQTVGCSDLCDGPQPDSLLADFSNHCSRLISSGRLCCLICRVHGFFHILHCPRVRAIPSRAEAEPVYSAAAKRDILAIAARTLHRATPQLSASPPVETAGDCGGGGGDAEVDEERKLLAAQRPRSKSPPAGWFVRQVEL